MAFAEEDRPRLVPLEPQPVTLEDGSRAVALRDPLGIVGRVAVVSPAAYWVLAHFDGRRTLGDVVRAASRRGRSLSLTEVVGLALRLRRAGLVHGPAYDALRSRALTEYRAAPSRPPACAGGAYPGDAPALRAMLDGLFAHPEGPGGRPGRPGGGSLKLLVSPHIDYRRGGPGYAHAFRALAERCDAELFVVFGTAHASPPHLFTLTRQSFDTPLGPAHTDRALVDALAAALGEEELLGDELCHRQEHSVELQLVWLRHLFPNRALTVLPVLCSSISHLSDPASQTDRFLSALRRAVAGRKVCYIAGADLAHVGPQYGDREPPTPKELAALAAQDRRTLGFLVSGDAAGFHADAVRDDERRRLCGVAPIYAAMRMARVRARLLHYAQWTDGVDSVSFAAAAG